MERMTRCSGAVSVRDLGYTPRGASLPVLSGISFDVCPGELVLLAGPSGSGKTTMLRAIKPEPPLPGLLSGVLTSADGISD
ncbi:MAG: ATP-binding cassette domain-containing protein [Clostridia bacterium]|nr:ATP-binding cassette domain-containing protein [Clostridia bacterium]